MKSNPIGIFDSGVGGLTVVKEILKKLPNEDIIYLGDTARVPYGTRSKEVVRKFARQDVDFLRRKNVKCIVIACNTVSSQVGDEIRNSINIPILDVLTSGVTGVCKLSVTSVGVIATNGTINSNAYVRAIETNSRIKVIQKACPLFVPLIEEGEIKGKLIDLVIEKYLKNFKLPRIQAMLLGCTHYPLIKQGIKKCIGNDIKIVDSAGILATDLKNLLAEKNLLNRVNKEGKRMYFLTDTNSRFIKIAKQFMGKDISHQVKLIELA